MWRLATFSLAVACSGIIGCTHMHSVLTVDVVDRGERIKTRYRYRVVVNVPGHGRAEFGTASFAKWQPEVFDPTGIPVELAESDVTLQERSSGTAFFSALTLWTFPWIETAHEHKTWSFRIAPATGADMSVRACGRATFAMANTPLPFLVFNLGGKPCVTGGRTFDEHSCQSLSNAHIGFELEQRAKAYALAVRLKELEDSGKINDALAAAVISAQNVAGVAWAQRARLESEKRIQSLKGLPSGGKDGADCRFEIVELECEAGRDFAYRFVIAQKGKMSLADYGAIRNAFRATICEQYAMKHPGVNPRSLVADFVEYSASGGRIQGRVVVLTLATESITYDAATRRGRMSVRVGANQLEEARRWIRQNIGELAARSNISSQDGTFPPRARFYSGSETLHEDGILEVEFKTE